MSIFLATPLFTLASVLVVIAGLLAFNLTVPYRVVGDAEHGNPAAATVVGGLLVSLGIIAHGALVQTRTFVDFVILCAFGIAVDIAAYHVLEWLTPGWSLDRAIHESRSIGAGILAAGVLITAGLIVAGAMS